MTGFFPNKKDDFREFISGESGQTTVEYILILACVVGLALIVINNLIRPGYEKVAKALYARIEKQILKADLHRFHIQK